MESPFTVTISVERTLNSKTLKINFHRVRTRRIIKYYTEIKNIKVKQFCNVNSNKYDFLFHKTSIFRWFLVDGKRKLYFLNILVNLVFLFGRIPV